MTPVSKWRNNLNIATQQGGLQTAKRLRVCLDSREQLLDSSIFLLPLTPTPRLGLASEVGGIKLYIYRTMYGVPIGKALGQ